MFNSVPVPPLITVTCSEFGNCEVYGSSGFVPFRDFFFFFGYAKSLRFHMSFRMSYISVKSHQDVDSNHEI